MNVQNVSNKVQGGLGFYFSKWVYAISKSSEKPLCRIILKHFFGNEHFKKNKS